MKIARNCQNCEFNFDGTCGNGNEVYEYGQKITDDTKVCSVWDASLNCFIDIKAIAPRFIREAFEDFKISFGEMFDMLEADQNGKPIELNIFDAIKPIYGISIVDIAVMMDVSFGVVFQAKTRKIPLKRIQQFAEVLCIPEKFLTKVTTADFEKLKECKRVFDMKTGLISRLDDMPEWKARLASEISTCLRCPIHIAKEISRVDKLYWSASANMNEYTDSELILLKYITGRKNAKKNASVVEVSYSLDSACKPHFHMTEAAKG